MNNVDVYDITNQKYLGKVQLSTIDQKYNYWRGKGIGIFVDRSGDICLDMEYSDDDGLYYIQQIEKLK